MMSGGMVEGVPAGGNQYFETIQPEWKNLSFTTEVVRLLWEFPDADDITEADPVVEANAAGRVSRQLRFLKALNLIGDSENLKPNGVWLATIYQSAAQRPITSSGVSLDRKETLATAEKRAFRGLLLGHHWLPMVATAHQLSRERVPSESGGKDHVDSFAQRLDDIDEYSGLSSGAWETRAKVHYNWFQSIDFADYGIEGYSLTDDGRDFFERVEEYTPSGWDDSVSP